MISKAERAMKKSLKDAGHTIADYIDPAPGADRDPEETLDELIGEIDNDEVGRAIAQSDQAEGLPVESQDQIAQDLLRHPETEAFADYVDPQQGQEAPANENKRKGLPLGKTGS